MSAQSNYINLGNSALKQGDYDRAAEQYEKAHQHCKEEKLTDQNLSILSALTGNISSAIQDMDGYIRKDDNNARLLYNRAIMHMSDKSYEAALQDFRKASENGNVSNQKLEREAYALQRESEVKQVESLLALAQQETDGSNYDKALAYYQQALLLRPAESYVLFKMAHIGLLQGNPFTTIDAVEQFPKSHQTDEQKLELILLKAYSYGRINKMKEAVTLLENSLYSLKTTDLRPRKLLSYYYLKLSQHEKAIRVLNSESYSDPNTFVVAGNAAIHLKRFSLALECFQKAESFDPKNIDARIGKALCYSHLHKNALAIQLIDSLVVSHPDKHHVWNVKGIIYKDVGLNYKNNFRQQKANTFFVNSAAAFLTAKTINSHLKNVYESNRALSLFFQDKKDAARSIWASNDELSSQNNLALLYVSQNKYSNAYSKLDSLYNDYINRYRKKSTLIEYNRSLARSKTKLNNNYRFVTNFILSQDRPKLSVVNPFELPQVETVSSSNNFDYILAYSDEDCQEKSARKKSKKKKRIRLFKRKKKKYKGDCPKF